MEKHTPPPLRDAATIILVRETQGHLETYLLRRSTKSGFMGGLFVFPGGVVDGQDRGADFWLPRIDLDQPRIEKYFCNNTFDLESAVAFANAAIRETLEEAGVLIASAKDKARTDFDEMARIRLEQDLSDDWFRKTIAENDWTLLYSQLGCWSHWITPEKMKKRFDTRFFIVLMPENQTCVPDNLETTQGLWVSPAAALEQNLAGDIPLSPPTVVTLTELSKFASLEDLKKEMRTHTWGDPVAPILYPTDKGPVILEPWDPEFGKDAPPVLENLKEKVLEAGSPFSRIWCDKGIWKPVGL